MRSIDDLQKILGARVARDGATKIDPNPELRIIVIAISNGGKVNESESGIRVDQPPIGWRSRIVGGRRRRRRRSSTPAEATILDPFCTFRPRWITRLLQTRDQYY